ncbi:MULTISPECIES: hypothetical protein [unclassified Nostoc]|uniref:hypothetical protein n=1 Tax=unclassified Nostoc TaxID=2593658 RepID=UPI0025E1F8F8|nr:MULTISPECIES: hypothetical protein [unclassified Nostoc]
MKNQFDTTRNQPVRKFNQDAWRFGVQVFFSSIVLGLCIFKLGSPGEDKNVALYWGGLSSVLAYWLPSPGQTRDDKEQPSITQRTFAAADSNNGNGQSLAQVTETKVTPNTNS